MEVMESMSFLFLKDNFIEIEKNKSFRIYNSLSELITIGSSLYISLGILTMGWPYSISEVDIINYLNLSEFISFPQDYLP